jgi:hypothetical protein
VRGDGGTEDGQHDGPGDLPVRGEAEHQPGVVIQPAQDLRSGPGLPSGQVSR